MSAEPLLTVSGLRVHFPLRHREVVHAVDGVDLTMTRGETLGLVGESGCGKSTLGRVIVGLQAPTEGEIRYDSAPLPPRREAAMRQKIQMVFQDPYSSLNPRMTVGQTLGELLRVHHVVPRDRVGARTLELLGQVGLGADARDSHPGRFSGGQRQRIGIARALALRPELLIADEPVSALDVSVQATVLNLLADLKRTFGLTMLLIAHNMAIVRQVCDRVAVMYLGKIVEVAPAEQLFTDPRHPYTQGLLASVPRLAPGRRPTAGIAGEPGSPVDPPAGCRFHPRCPLAQDICRTEEPAPTRRPHNTACHFA